MGPLLRPARAHQCRETLDQFEWGQHQTDAAARSRLDALIDQALRIGFTQAFQRKGRSGALVRQPKVLLLDEPFAAPDVMLRERVRRELAELQARVRIPLVVITHDVDDVKIFAETLVVYGLGEVSRVLPCKTLRERHGDAHAWREMSEACGLSAA